MSDLIIEIEEMYVAGKTLEQISEKLNIPKYFVLNVIHSLTSEI